MNVTRLRLANFKRFTDLTIDLSSCAGAPKLVLLIGANGSGKSSVFDAFEYLSAHHKGEFHKGEEQRGARDSALRVFPNKTLVLCENTDAPLYNAIDLPDLLFVASRNRNAVGLQIRANEELRGLIDRDYIGSE